MKEPLAVGEDSRTSCLALNKRSFSLPVTYPEGPLPPALSRQRKSLSCCSSLPCKRSPFLVVREGLWL